jgi:hypothetical protein
MVEPIVVVERLVPAPRDLFLSGLRYFATVSVGPLRIDGVQIRIGRDARWLVSWPAKDTNTGRRICVVAPTDDPARCYLEAEILKAIQVRNIKSETVP